MAKKRATSGDLGARPEADQAQPQTPSERLGGDHRVPRHVARAVRERWPIPAEVRANLANVCTHVAFDSARTPRERMSAVRSLAMLDRLNIEADRLDLEGELAGGSTAGPQIVEVVEPQSVVAAILADPELQELARIAARKGNSDG